MKNLSKFFAFALLVCGVKTVSAQNSLTSDATKKAAEVNTLVNGGRYTFKLETANLKATDTASAAYGTGMDISKDTLIAYLPGLGKDPAAAVSAGEAGITCINFSYNMAPSPKGGYDVSIVPAEKYATNARNIKTISMHISKMGYADVKVTTADHGVLQYHGYIKQHGATFTNTVVSN